MRDHFKDSLPTELPRQQQKLTDIIKIPGKNISVSIFVRKTNWLFYIFPKYLPNTGAKDISVIGGTFIEGATPKTPNEKEFDILLEGAKKFYGIQ